jgi:hypothetical protein
LSRNIQKLGTIKRDQERQRLMDEKQKQAAWRFFFKKNRKGIDRIDTSKIWNY